MLFLKIMQDLENNRKGLADYLLKQQKIKIKTSKKIIESIVKFQANETKKLSALSWDKNRYQKLKTMNIFRPKQFIILTCFIFQQRRNSFNSAP
jgi:hypothetical protein